MGFQNKRLYVHVIFDQKLYIYFLLDYELDWKKEQILKRRMMCLTFWW